MPKGYEVHGGTLRVYFTYQGARHREKLGLPDTPKNRDYAANLAATIRHEVQAGTFDYAKHFPDSKKVADNTLGHWAELFLSIKKSQVSPETYLNYRRWVNGRVVPKWGNYQADKVDSIDVEQWMRDELTDLNQKSIREVLALMRQIYSLYRRRNRSAFDPTEGIKLVMPDDEDADPFTMDEIKKILQTSTESPGDLNLVQFSIWTGPRPSETLALGWDDIDMETGEVVFQRALVRGIYKSTKTKRSTRRLTLLKPALEALQAQHKLTGALGPVSIDVLQRDNRTWRPLKFRPVFVNRHSGKPYCDSKNYMKNFFTDHLAAAGVRHRGIGNCRHTFASQMLTAGMPERWICEMLGHTSEAMLRRRYGKYIKEDAKIDMARVANQAFGF